ncbi:hypothetical protein [Desulfatibacillum aliphaticivorans]|uniref:hypothetical protein n=1 Tax=Desulfatibacillum aliphaticivorans TaxID=218208 RepID=UPI0003FE0536|nr:hypothetical protein [Desulfatibacillum aliphaticivorans]
MIYGTMIRYKTLLALLAVLIGLGGASAFCQESPSAMAFHVSDELVDDAALHPVDYLSSYVVPDAAARLSPEDRERLVFLFLSAAQACEHQDSPDSALRTCSPLYILLKSNFPNIAFVEREEGKLVYLADIAGPLSDYIGP